MFPAAVAFSDVRAGCVRDAAAAHLALLGDAGRLSYDLKKLTTWWAAGLIWQRCRDAGVTMPSIGAFRRGSLGHSPATKLPRTLDALSGVPLRDIANPFEPLHALLETGYSLLDLIEKSGEVVLLVPD